MVKSPTLKDADEDQDLFYFESDVVALKGNPDYSEMLKVFVTLQAQRNIAIENCSAVSELKKRCLDDPLGCVEKLRAGKLEVPPMLRIAELPYVNWSKYNVKIPETYIKQLNVTRCKSTSGANVEHRKARLSWTVDEQRKLEELLVKYPPEPVEANRNKKIAQELGTRTEKQVASRLQKYYLKLVNSGMPISGQLPGTKIQQKFKKSMRKKFMKPTTFLPNLQVPVNMSDLDDVPGASSLPGGEGGHSSNSENYLLSTYSSTNDGGHEDADKSDIRLQLELVSRIKQELVFESAEYKLYSHFGFTCDYCREDPIRGSRWHCAKCTSESVDFCTNCMLSQLYSSRPHSLRHKFLVVRNDRVILDPSDSESDTDSEKNDDGGAFDSSGPVKDEHGFSEHCPVDIFEPTKRMNGDTQDVAYGYLHSNLFADNDDERK